MKKVLWLGGWAVPSDVCLKHLSATFPDDQHAWVHPTEAWRNQLYGEIDIICGYSLGAYLLLKDQPTLSCPVHLYAPFLDFKAEGQLGGRVRTTQLKILLRQLRQNPLTAVNQFYKDAGLPYQVTELPYSQEDLIWGIEQLLHTEISHSLRLQENWLAYGGKADALIDYTILQSHLRLQIRAGTGHDLAELIQSKDLSHAI